MKKFAVLALLLSLGVFASGCTKSDTKKADDKMGGAAAPADAGAAPAEGAAAPADAAAPAETK